MKSIRFIGFCILFGLFGWGIINPDGFHAAIANNKWSLMFVENYYNEKTEKNNIHNPPISHPHAKLLLAREAINSGDDELALEYIIPFVGPDNPMMTNAYAEIAYRQQNYTEAIRAWEMAGNTTALHNTTYELREKGLLDNALLAAQSRYKLDRETSTSNLATIYSDLKKFDSAIDLLDQSVNEFPDSSYRQTWISTKSSILFVQANDLFSKGMLKEAEETFRESVIVNPNNWGAWKRLGWFYYHSYDDVQSAIDCFKGEITANPENGEGQYDLATLYAIEINTESATYWYEQAISQRPDRGDFQLNYAIFLRNSQDLSKAIQVYDQLLISFPDYVDAHYEAAKAYAQFDQPDKAILSIERAIQLMNPPPLRYYLLAGSLYEENGLREQAIDAFDNALLIDPKSPEALQAKERLAD